MDAIETVFHNHNPDVCARCDKRIFLECQSIEYHGKKPLVTDKTAAA
jgi:hypothetical protein